MIRNLLLVGTVVALAMCSSPNLTETLVGTMTMNQPEPAYSVHTGSIETEGATMNYMVEVPATYDPAREYGLMVYLHGAGQHGREISAYAESHQRARPLDEDPDRYPLIVLMPQMPSHSRWSFFSEGVLALVDRVAAEYAIDEDRIYMTGYSDGGYGALAIGAAGAERFAAVLGGGTYWLGDTQPLCALAEHSVPVSLHHAELDTIIPFEQALNVEDHLMACGADVRLIAYQGETHISVVSLIFQDAGIYEWLLAQRRAG